MLDNDIFEEMQKPLEVDTQELTPTQLELEKGRIASPNVVDKVRIEQKTSLKNLEMNEWNNVARSRKFNLKKQIRLLPKFSEKVDNYFSVFLENGDKF